MSLQDSDRPEVDDVDLVHIFNCRVPDLRQQMATQRAGKPVVVSPIWISIGRALWGSRGSVALLEQAVKQGADAAEPGFVALRERAMTVHLPNGTVNAQGQGSVDLGWQREVAFLLRQCQGMLPNSWLELKAVQSDLPGGVIATTWRPMG